MGKIQILVIILFLGMCAKASEINTSFLSAGSLESLEYLIRRSESSHEFKQEYLIRYHRKYPSSPGTLDLNYILSMVDLFGESIENLRPYYLEKIQGSRIRFRGKKGGC